MLNRQFAFKTSAVTLFRICNAALNILLLVVLARMIGADGVGVYSYLIILITLFLIPFNNGAHTLVLKLAAEATANGIWSESKGSVIASVWAVLVYGALLFLVLYCLWLYKPAILAKFDLGLIVAIVVLLLIDGTAAIRNGLMRGLDRPVWGSMPELVVRPAILLLCLAGYHLSRGPPAGFADIVYLLVLASFLASAFGLVIAWRSTPPEAIVAQPAYRSEWISSSASFASKGGIAVINNYVDIILLGVLLVSSAEIGIYRVAAQIAVVSGLVYVSANSIATQVFARKLAEGDISSVQNTARNSARLAFAASIPLPVIVLLFGEALITMVFGAEFSPAADIALILLVGQMINSAFGSAAALLTVSDRSWLVSRWFAYAALSNALLCFYLIPVAGLAGAAIANVAAGLVLNLALWIIAWRDIGVDTSIIGRNGWTTSL